MYSFKFKYGLMAGRFTRQQFTYIITQAMNWIENDNKLYQSFVFKDFSGAFAFITRVALLAEAQNHHPVIKNQYNIVELWLSTHDMGNMVTEKDYALAASINELFPDYEGTAPA